jgi:hypothetical protein
MNTRYPAIGCMYLKIVLFLAHSQTQCSNEHMSASQSLRKCGRFNATNGISDILKMAERGRTTNVRRISDVVGSSWMHVWKTLHDFCQYPFHAQTIQAQLPITLNM